MNKDENIYYCSASGTTSWCNCSSSSAIFSFLSSDSCIVAWVVVVFKFTLDNKKTHVLTVLTFTVSFNNTCWLLSRTHTLYNNEIRHSPFMFIFAVRYAISVDEITCKLLSLLLAGLISCTDIKHALFATNRSNYVVFLKSYWPAPSTFILYAAISVDTRHACNKWIHAVSLLITKKMSNCKLY